MPAAGTSLRRATSETHQGQKGRRESDDSLLARVGNGRNGSDRDAWAELVDRHLPPITRYAAYVLRDPARAVASLGLDCAQLVFEELSVPVRAPGRVRLPAGGIDRLHLS